MLSTFTFVTVAWVFFRAETLGDAVGYINIIIRDFIENPFQILHLPVIKCTYDNLIYLIILLVIIFIFQDWNICHGKPYRLKRNRIYHLLMASMVILNFFGGDAGKKFIYFNF
jgi:hypothetical protein